MRFVLFEFGALQFHWLLARWDAHVPNDPREVKSQFAEKFSSHEIDRAPFGGDTLVCETLILTSRIIVSNSFIVPEAPTVLTDSFDIGESDMVLEFMTDIAAPVSTRNSTDSPLTRRRTIGSSRGLEKNP